VAEESDLEKTEEPSPRKLEQAREEGQIPQSQELGAFLVMAAGAIGLWGFSGWFVDHGRAIMTSALTLDRQEAFDTNALGYNLLTLGGEAIWALLPFFIITMVAAFLTPILLTGGFVFSPKALMFKFERISPINGVKRMFSWYSVAELVKGILKTLLLVGIVWWVVAHERDNLFALISQPLEAALSSFGSILLYAFIGFVAGLAVIALLDVPFQLWRFYDEMKMSMEDLKQEFKETEGDPYLKAHIRGQQIAMARSRMMSEVPKADVVVTNPTHFAVAIRYDRDKDRAPRVVAKGMNLVAQRIRGIAEEHRVPILELPPLARALHHHVDIGEHVPSALYTAVAEVMAYIYRLNDSMKPGGGMAPEPLLAVAVPEGLDPGSLD